MTIQDQSMTIERLDAANWRVTLPNVVTANTGQSISLVMHVPRNPRLTLAQVRDAAVAQAIDMLQAALAAQQPAIP